MVIKSKPTVMTAVDLTYENETIPLLISFHCKQNGTTVGINTSY